MTATEVPGENQRRAWEFQDGGTRAVSVLAPISPLEEPYDLDLIGDLQFARYNFADLVNPYESWDGYLVIKGSYWLDRKSRNLGPYAEIVPVFASNDAFHFQRHVEFRGGMQWYPFSKPTLEREFDDDTPFERLRRAFRVHGFAGGRGYYDEQGKDLVDDDFQAGIDYYYDTLFEWDRLGVFIFSNLAYRDSDFDSPDFQSLIWNGNIQVGPKIPVTLSPFQGLLIPYAVADWSWVPDQPDYFRNYLHLGGGIRFYPWTDQGGGPFHDAKRRFHIFAEALANVAWFQNSPPPGVEQTDFRIGASFSTGGIFRD